jgi:hypothetical protein
LLEGNSQVAIFESKSAKFDREITYFRVKKPKTQVTSFISDLQRYLSEHPGDAGDETQRSLTALGECIFEDAEEAGLIAHEFHANDSRIKQRRTQGARTTAFLIKQ